LAAASTIRNKTVRSVPSRFGRGYLVSAGKLSRREREVVRFNRIRFSKLDRQRPPPVARQAMDLGFQHVDIESAFGKPGRRFMIGGD
jgi:hypothetical protein